jgi:hypothetical protein
VRGPRPRRGEAERLLGPRAAAGSKRSRPITAPSPAQGEGAAPGRGSRARASAKSCRAGRERTRHRRSAQVLVTTSRREAEQEEKRQQPDRPLGLVAPHPPDPRARKLSENGMARVGVGRQRKLQNGYR